MSSSSLGNFTSLSTLSLAGGAEISAFHPGAKLLFTIGGTGTLSVVDLSYPNNPIQLTTLTQTLAGVGNSVAVSSSGLVAVAVEGAGTARYTEGKVAFFKVTGVGSAATVTAAGSVAVGIVPDSIAFTPDGTKLVVANEGEPNELYTVDPVGSVSVISINGTTPASSTVQTVDFAGLNGRAAELAALGIRVSGKDGNTVAQNLEPEYVAISADGKKAYVTFQENNAVGVINLEGASPSLESLRSVGVQDYVRGQASIKTYDVTIASPGTTAAGGVVPGGGLSGLFATGTDSNGRLTFLAPADRGPNGAGTTKDVVKADGSAGTDGTADSVQPFLLPDYQARFYKLALNEATGVVSVTGEVKLTRKDGTTPITGRSNGKEDQIPVDANGNLLAYDTYGADLESIVQDKDGNIWMSDEYRPAIYKFDATGKLIERYVPVGAGVAAGLTAGALGAETLPAEYAKRQTNRGFEGLAYDAANGKLFAFVQSPLDDVGANDGTKGSLVRILEVAAATGQPTAEYLYAMAGKGSTTAASDSPFYESKVDKIGDVAYDAARQMFYVLERDSTAGALSYKQVFEMSLKGATNILGNAVTNEENLSIDALKAQGISLANKVLITNLSSEGYVPNDKPEGLALLADGRLAVINDNDFGVTGLDAAAYNALSTAEKAKYSLASDIGGSKTYVYANGADAKVQLGIVTFTPTGIDATDKAIPNASSPIALLNNQNIYGLRMPDGIATFQAIGKNGSTQTFTVIANEGDTRVRPEDKYTDANGTETAKESVYVDTLTTDNSGIGVAADKNLKIIKDLGNYDGTTAAYEQKFAFGGRSISILDSLGNVIWDSGDAIDKAAIEANAYDDGRSDDKGSEPENVTVATIDGRTYAFVALERAKSIAAFDITNPYDSSLVNFKKLGTGIEPEGLFIIPASQSTNGKTLLVTSNEKNKYLEILTIGQRSPLLKPIAKGLKTSEVFTIGDAVGTYFPTGTPDGMGAYLKDANTIRLLFQSEIGKDKGYAYTLANGTQLTGARIHYLDLDKTSNAVLASGLAYDKVFDRAGVAVTSANQISADGTSTKNGFDRFCAANLIEANAFGTNKGFVDRIEFLGEESSTAYANLGGTMVALDVANSALYAMPDLGFGSWESATAIDTGNANQIALILGDDYASDTVGAPIYMYVGTKSTAQGASFLERNGLTGGKLYAWVSTTGAALNRPSEFKGFGTSSTGSWVEIATKDATKAKADIKTLTQAEYDALTTEQKANYTNIPVTNADKTTTAKYFYNYDAAGYKSATLLRKDADSKNAFLAARIEDLDVNPNKTSQVAFVATGNEAFDGGADLLGTVYTLDVSFNGALPAAGTLKIVYDGDDTGNGSAGLRSPDNIAFSKDGFIYAQEDKAVYSAASEPKYGTEKGSIWKLDPTTGKAVRWVQIDDSIDPDGAGGQALNKDDSGYKAYGWESSGIIDVSALYNHAPGTDFFANVQTHGVSGGAITDQNLAAGGQILKIENKISQPLFNSGVASGDPYADSVILWTRIDPKNTFSASVAVNWEISTSKTFSNIIKSGIFTTNKDRDWTVKVEADGLTAGTQYYYRFLVGDRASEIGSTKTLATNPSSVHLGLLSCANFTAESEFLVYDRASDINTANPFDAFVFVGDYIYEYGKGGYSSAESAATTRGFEPNKEITSLDDYRQRYAQYHTDVNLRNLRAGAPLIAIWDDHETANDSYGEGAENHQPATEGDWIARRDAALKAYYEWMPIREPQLRDGTDQGTAQTPLTKGYRSFDFGDVLSLHILETRLLARDKQLAYPDATAVQTRLGAILQSPSSIAAYASKYGVAAPTSVADGTRFATALAPYVTNELVAAVVGEAYFGNREMMGKEQLDWLKNEMATSNASWQVLGQQVLMQNIAIPAELLLNAGDPKVLAKYATPLQKLALGQTLTAAEQALFNEAGKIPYNLDAWDGYGAEREEIIKAALQLGKKLVSLAGDTHNAWAGVLDAASNADIAQQAFPTGTFLVGTENRAAFKEIITSGEETNNAYRFNGIPDGIGVIDNGTTLRVVVNHEFATDKGVARSHGSKGAYVSDLVIDKATLAVISGGDFLKSANDLYLANSTGTAWTNGTTTAFNRFCSGDLADVTAFKTATAGYDGRIYLTGEESKVTGRAFAHILTGDEKGRVYELPSLGNLSFENIVANPIEQAKTVAVALDDDGDGKAQVYLYIGTKAASGNAVEKAGLAGGKLFGVKVGSGASVAKEVGDLSKPTETGLALTNGAGSFTLVDLGDVKGKDGATLNTESEAAGVTNFLRPEDGAWSLDGKAFYFATTASATTASRLWALEFTSSANPENGGTIRMLLDGSEGQVMIDNLTVAKDGTILLQEDPGENPRIAKIWSYNPTTDKLTEIAQHDPAQFTGTTSGTGNITIDEESSGIVDITSFLTTTAGYDTSKYNYFLVADQIHKTVTVPDTATDAQKAAAAEQVEMGQLTLMATSAQKVVPQQAFPTGTFLVGTENRAAFKEIITSGEETNNAYRFNGIPDGIGVIDNGTTLRVVVNHEFATDKGVDRSHGSKGAYVSDLVIDKATLAVISGGDFLKSANDLYLANSEGTAWTNNTTTAFNRFCSGDLADVTAFKTTTAGYDGRIYLTGEENKVTGRAFAHILTGTEAGRVYELPSLGNLSFENIVANPIEQAKTVAVALDDDGDGKAQVYLYIGTKSATGNAVEKAGLAGGKLFGVKVGSGASVAKEVGDLSKPTETGLALTNGAGSFTLVDLGDVKGKDGATLNTESEAAGVTNFLRPEDGAWSLDGKTFYFATTASATTASRLWALEFTSSANPENGGTIRMLLDGSEGQVMIDNLTVAKDGTILLQEDPGGNDRLAKIWSYNLSTDKLTELAQHDPNLFTGANKLTNDEESSGIVDITPFLTTTAGYDTSKFNYFLVADQIHKGVTDPAEVVEMGQLTLMATPKVPITPGTVAGIELATPGVTSPGFEKYFPGVSGLDSLFEAYAKDLDYANLQNRGFLDLTFTKSSITAGFEYLKGQDPVTKQANWERDTLITDSSYTFKEYNGVETPLLKARVNGLKISEVLTIGEAVGTYFPTGTPDGMGAYLKDANTIRLLFQSEITKDAGYTYKLANNTELTGARIHYLDIDKTSNAVLASGLAYDKVYDRAGNLVTSANQISADGNSSKNGFDRFCAANLIEAYAFGTGNGFVDRIHFLGEESSSAYGNLGGTMVALDVASNSLYALPDLGFGSWESATAVDTGNANQVALILGDDYASATLGAPIYMYVGTKITTANASFLERNGLAGGKLYAWVASTGAALNRPSEFKGFGSSSTGTWVEIATKDATKAGTTGYDALGYKSAALLRADADSKNAFLAARIEDLDVNPNKTSQVAFVATGNEAFDGGADLLGTVYTLDVSFNGALPAAGTLKIVYDGDDAGNGSAGLRSPDNIAFSKDGFIYAQEDKAVYSAASEPKYGTEKGSIWKLDPTTGKAVRWVQIDDSIDPDGAGGQALDKTDSGYLAYGWESSGIIDVSALYNHAPGTDFFANVHTHGVKGGAITDQKLAAGGQILKIEVSNGAAQVEYTKIDGTVIKPNLRPSSGQISGDVTFSRMQAPPSLTNQSSKLKIGQTGLDFSLNVDSSSAGANTARAIVDLDPLLDGLELTTGATKKRLAYFVYDTSGGQTSPTATAFTYDPVKKAGARFYDLDGNGSADTADLQFVDGGYGDKDGVKNGVVVDPSTAGAVDLTAIFTASANSLTVGDPTDTSSPASLVVRASLSSRSSTVNQIGYVALNASESLSLSYDLVKERGTLLFGTLANNDVPDLSSMRFQRDINLINGQKLMFFEVVDNTLEAILKGGSLDSSFRTLDVTKLTDSSATAGKGGSILNLFLSTDVSGLGELISSQMGEAPVFDFSSLSGQTLTGDVLIAREASFDSTIGFYKLERSDGAVRDTLTNTLIMPGEVGYTAAALRSDNLFSGFGSLATGNRINKTATLDAFKDAGLLAPFARVANTGEIYFSFGAANSDGLNHFRVLGSGVLGLEDIKGGGDRDFDDLIVGFNFKLSTGTLA